MITQRMAVHYPAESQSLLRVHLEMMFQSVTPIERSVAARLDGTGGGKGAIPGLRVFDAVDVLVTGPAFLTLEWVSGAANDLIADAVLATILQIHAAQASIEALHHLQEHDSPAVAAVEPSPDAPLLPALKREPADAGLAASLASDTTEVGKREADDADVAVDTASRKERAPAVAAAGELGASDSAIELAAAAYHASLPKQLVRHLLDGIRQHYDVAALDASGQLITVLADGLSALIDCRTCVRRRRVRASSAGLGFGRDVGGCMERARRGLRRGLGRGLGGRWLGP